MARDPRLERKRNRGKELTSPAGANPAETKASAGQGVRSGLRGKQEFATRFVPLDVISEHPENKFSMDEDKIIALARNIEEVGLLDVPLVWITPEGQTQLLSGHRRFHAYKYNREHVDAERYASLPVRVREDVKTPEKALVILHAANFFTRDMTESEKAASIAILYKNVMELRKADASLAGKRTNEIAAETLSQEGGEKISARDVSRLVAIDEKLTDGLKKLWDKGVLNKSQAEDLSKLPEVTQDKFFEVAREYVKPLNKDQFDTLRASAVGVQIKARKPKGKAAQSIHSEAKAKLKKLEGQIKDLVDLKKKGAVIDPEVAKVLKEGVEELLS